MQYKAVAPYSSWQTCQSLFLQNLLDSRAQLAAKAASSSSPGAMTPTSPEAGQHTHTADLLRMTRESMNGSLSARLHPAGKQSTSLCLTLA